MTTARTPGSTGSTGPAADRTAAPSSRLDAARRRAALEHAAADGVDVLVVGLGVTGAGVALDAASRGLSVLAVDADDLAFGTSRWSSKLVHGGLRYLAKGQVGIARESAVERGILMTRTAPHLTHAMPMLLPLTPAMSRAQTTLAQQGLRAGDALRIAAGTPRTLLPRPRRLGTAETCARVPGVATEGLRGSLLSHDGQLEDDVRLVVALARTAAAYGALVATRTRAVSLGARGAVLRDELTGETLEVRAGAVVNATGVWADQLVPGLRLTPSRGTHLVLGPDALPGVAVSLTAPVPGSLNRYVFTLPQSDGRTYLGLTDEPVEGDLPDVPVPAEAEIDFLLETIGSALAVPLTRSAVVGAFAGLRPLLSAEGSTSDLSRRHAVITSPDGVVTVVGGKLTTYRAMAQDAVDTAVAQRGLRAGPCLTHDLPLVGAAPRAVLAQVDAPRPLVRRYGAEAPEVLQTCRRLLSVSPEEASSPVAQTAVTLADLVWGATHEGALSVDDLLDRRTRVGLVGADRAAVAPVAAAVLRRLT